MDDALSVHLWWDYSRLIECISYSQAWLFQIRLFQISTYSKFFFFLNRIVPYIFWLHNSSLRFLQDNQSSDCKTGWNTIRYSKSDKQHQARQWLEDKQHRDQGVNTKERRGKEKGVRSSRPVFQVVYANQVCKICNTMLHNPKQVLSDWLSCQQKKRKWSRVKKGAK